jgi:leader peptidase (prepilin peptidase) / N-methyltransferase
VRALLILLLAAAGVAISPALRALIIRLSVPAGESWRRACPACAAPLGRATHWPARPRPAAAGGTRQAVGSPSAAPRSWLPAFLPADRCADCGNRLGPPAFTVELTAAVLLGALAARVHPALVLAAACWLALCAIPLAFIDAAARRLPDVLTGPAFAGTVVLLLAAAAAGGQWPALGRAVLGGVALAGFYVVLALISPSGMGMGDVKAAAALGTMLAWQSWTALLVGGVAGFLLAAVYGIALLISGRATRKQHIPFGPFMITGAFLIILAGLS